MRLQSCITQATLSLALVASPVLAQSPVPSQRNAVYGQQSWLGVGIVDLTPEKVRQMGLGDAHGVEVALIAKGGPAEDAGLQRGDIITRFSKEKVLGAEHLAQLVRKTPSGRTVELEVWRDGNQRQVNVVVERRGAPADGDIAKQFNRQPAGVGFDIPRPIAVVRNRSLGMELEAIESQLATFFGVEQGILVRSVEAGSVAQKAGITAGDVIVRVGNRDVADPGDLRRETQRATASVEVGIVRNRRERTLLLPKEAQSEGSWPLSRRN